jgi:hypothetical protein
MDDPEKFFRRPRNAVGRPPRLLMTTTRKSGFALAQSIGGTSA